MNIETKPRSAELTDSDKLRKLAYWFDLTDTERGYEGYEGDEVQQDLRRIADKLESYEQRD